MKCIFYTNNIYYTTKEKRSNNAIVLTLSEKGRTESERVNCGDSSSSICL